MNAPNVNQDCCFVLVTPERAPLTIFNWKRPKPPAPGWVPIFTTYEKAEAFLCSIPFSNLPARRDLQVAVVTKEDFDDRPEWMRFEIDPLPLPPRPQWVN